MAATGDGITDGATVTGAAAIGAAATGVTIMVGAVVVATGITILPEVPTIATAEQLHEILPAIGLLQVQQEVPVQIETGVLFHQEIQADVVLLRLEKPLDAEQAEDMKEHAVAQPEKAQDVFQPENRV